MNPEDLEAINAARMADVLMGNLEPYFQKQRSDIVSKMKMLYRSGEYTESSFAACAASLCVLDDLENQLRSKYRKGAKLSKELYDDQAKRD